MLEAKAQKLIISRLPAEMRNDVNEGTLWTENIWRVPRKMLNELGSDIPQPACRIPKSLDVCHSESVREAQEKIGHRLGDMLNKTPRRQCSAPGPREYHGQIRMRVAIPISVAATIDDH